MFKRWSHKKIAAPVLWDFSPNRCGLFLTVHTLFIISFCTFSHWINGYFSYFFGYFKPFLGFSRLFYILYSACQSTSVSFGQFLSLHSPRHISEAAIIGKALFLLPWTESSPRRRFPPFTINFCIIPPHSFLCILCRQAVFCDLFTFSLR